MPHRRIHAAPTALAVLAACAVLVALPGALVGCASMEDLDLEGVLGEATLDEATVVRGLKEALTVGTTRATARVGRPDGYLADELLRITLPAGLTDVAGTLRRVGLGSQVDELEVAMNRAAEAAAGEATALFVEAVRGMTLQDAWAILDGPDDAATQFFRARTAVALTGRYRPIVSQQLRRVGGYAEYESLVSTLEDLPLVDPPDLDLVGYVTDRALDGLFLELAQEEARIRRDPLARTTALLRRVFGS